MKFLVTLLASLGLIVSSVSGFVTYRANTGLDFEILTTSGSLHSYNGTSLSPNVSILNANLSEASLVDADLSNTGIESSYFNNGDLSNASVYSSFVYRTNFIGTNLSNVDFSNSTLNEVGLKDAYLWGADLQDAYIESSDLRDADFTASNQNSVVYYSSSLQGSIFTNANLRYSNFAESNLYGVNFNNADLSYSVFSGYLNLAYVNFTDTILCFSDLRDALVGSTYIFTGANLYGALLPEDYDQSWFESRGAVFIDPVPEPSTYALLLGGTVLGYAFWRRRK
ncbi:MAG: pentapeptide repeat-containing protein [Coraliomargaritaceae bacterium]